MNNEEFTKYLEAFRFDIDFLIDVGVFKGTPALYDAFPDVHTLLIDPIHGLEGLLKDKPKSYTVFNTALGDTRGRIEFTEAGGRSTTWEINAFDAPTDADTGAKEAPHYSVPITTLDSLLAQDKFTGRFGMKIDVEGDECAVLRGAKSVMGRCEFVILEVTILQRFKNGSLFSDIIATLDKLGFEFYNLIDHWTEQPKFYDMLFLPKNTRHVPIKIDEHSIFDQVSQAQSLLNAGQLDTAKQLIDEILKLNDSNFEARFIASEIEEKSENYAAAAQHLEHALEDGKGAFKSRLSRTYRTLSRLYKKLENQDKALYYGEQSVEVDPNSNSNLYGLGKTRAWAQLYQKSNQCFIELSKRKPLDQRSYVELAVNYSAIGDQKSAALWLDKGEAIAPDKADWDGLRARFLTK